ncbi:beta-lactamase/transpeptidase-like protein [Lophiostoma macrostomum CBS 122681]|uniref:Beta-lactamase/transpeptidase-like protein n=1 Tax=Lophiostoma macrostomum CBS 122681 TaxID=1314788 RepID=A0A6A6T0S3_9PLEO|nr:beta-lactamase/transpeptidase-like protein [Lophiostoma macrostomum CBS 122681]
MMLFWAAFAVPALVGAQAAKPTDDCPILGPALPSDFDPSNATAIKDAISSFPSLIESLFESGAVNKSGTSFMIDVWSTQTNASIYQYSHSAETLDPYLTAGVLDDETQLRVGSVSKLFTAYALLNTAGLKVFDHYVTKYIPELAGNTDPGTIKWEEVTVGALAEQQGGTGGFPLSAISCYYTGTCSVQDFLSEMRDFKRPVIPVFQTAVYSDAGWGVLGLVLERLTNQSYAAALQSTLAQPLELVSSGATEPSAEGLNALALPRELTSWGMDNQISAPSGGVYSNTRDMRLMGLSILQSHFLSPAETREWMKPRSHTASLTSSVGAPWEIYRLSIPVSPASNRTRVSDLYTKTGGNVAYAAIFGLSPDHGIGFSILVGGETAVSERTPLRNLVGTEFVQAAEFAAFEHAQKNYAGFFADPNNESSNLTITVDEGKPGLGLPTFFVNGVDWRANVTQPALQASGDLFSIRLYPSGTEYSSSSAAGYGEGAQAVIKLFNAVAGSATPQPRSAVEGREGLFDDGCTQWENVGFFTASDFDLELVEGKLMSVLMRDSNVTMVRVE